MVVWYFGDCFRKKTWGWFVAEGIWYGSEAQMRAAYPAGTVFVMNLMEDKPKFGEWRSVAVNA